MRKLSATISTRFQHSGLSARLVYTYRGKTGSEVSGDPVREVRSVKEEHLHLVVETQLTNSHQHLEVGDQSTSRSS